MSDQSRTITYDLDEVEIYPLLINSLANYAEVLDRQSGEQAGFGEADYSAYLGGLADKARSMVADLREVFGDNESSR